MSEFKVGDKVVAVTSGGVQRSAKSAIVSRVLKSFIELDDGSRWRPDGQDVYPRPSYTFRSTFYELLHAGTAKANLALAKQRRDNMVSKLTSTKFSELSDDQLARFCAILKEGKL